MSTPASRPASRRRFLPGSAGGSLIVASLLTWALLVAPVLAETPAEVIEGAGANGGVYIAPGTGSFDEDGLASIVSRTQLEGVRLLVVAPREPEPNPEAFALRVRQAADIEAVLLFDPDGGIWASVDDDYVDGFVRAVEGARAAPTPENATEAFVQELLNEPDRPLPEVISTIIRWTILLLVALGLAALAEYLVRRRRRIRRAALETDEVR